MRYSGRTATAIVEYHPGLLLLIRRNTVPFKGYWALPGGRSELGETAEDTIAREVKEETGLDVSVVTKIGEYHESGIQDGVEYDYYPASFLVKACSGKMRKQKGEIQDLRLFSWLKIPGPLAFEHLKMIEDFLVICKSFQHK